jgi:signal transduction histidine kinase
MLLLARRVTVNGRSFIQGCWLNWPVLKESLLTSVADLLPEADLLPATDENGGEQTRLLAALPARVVPGDIATTPRSGLSPIRLALLMAWICVPLAVTAVAALLRGAVALSERRGAFVSAVTHELRTPLTTFRMYAEMLAEGMVPEEKKRTEYLKTLCSEADRLSHLVENVLAYARLERGRAPRRTEPVTFRALLSSAEHRLQARAAAAGMTLIVEADETVLQQSVMADPGAVEQILFNLTDNACKYADGTEDRRIHLNASVKENRGTLSVTDHGPGVQPEESRRLFRPFCKSARDAANSAPGVGLGLALSRRLTQDMGGELHLDLSVTDGARFVVSLPLA